MWPGGSLGSGQNLRPLGHQEGGAGVSLHLHEHLWDCQKNTFSLVPALHPLLPPFSPSLTKNREIHFLYRVLNTSSVTLNCWLANTFIHGCLFLMNLDKEESL